MIDKNGVLQLIKSQSLCVLSTASLSGKSESAVMAYTIKDDFTILINTEPTTRKYQNLLTNNRVSIVVGGFKNDPSVQIDGAAKILDGQKAQETRDYMLSVNPDLKNYFSDTGKFIAITPTWLRYSDFSRDPPEIYETNL